jgi:hypothetical protein
MNRNPQVSEQSHQDPVHKIKSWNLQFTGQGKEMPIEKFLFRIEKLCTLNLDGDFNSLARHAHLFLSDIAADWYWRSQEVLPFNNWHELSTALKWEFRVRQSDEDIMRSIRERKQRPSEKFEDFYRVILRLCDKLPNRIPEATLLSILKGNLLEHIQDELIYVPIFSVEALRDIMQAREAHYERKNRRNFSRPPGDNRRHHLAPINLDQSPNVQKEDESPIAAIEPAKIICWNCKKEGHRFQNCRAQPRTFCWGCGLDDVICPECPRCQSRNQANSKNFKRTEQMDTSVQTN